MFSDKEEDGGLDEPEVITGAEFDDNSRSGRNNKQRTASSSQHSDDGNNDDTDLGEEREGSPDEIKLVKGPSNYARQLTTMKNADMDQVVSPEEGNLKKYNLRQTTSQKRSYDYDTTLMSDTETDSVQEEKADDPTTLSVQIIAPSGQSQSTMALLPNLTASSKKNSPLIRKKATQVIEQTVQSPTSAPTTTSTMKQIPGFTPYQKNTSETDDSPSTAKNVIEIKLGGYNMQDKSGVAKALAMLTKTQVGQIKLPELKMPLTGILVQNPNKPRLLPINVASALSKNSTVTSSRTPTTTASQGSALPSVSIPNSRNKLATTMKAMPNAQLQAATPTTTVEQASDSEPNADEQQTKPKHYKGNRFKTQHLYEIVILRCQSEGLFPREYNQTPNGISNNQIKWMQDRFAERFPGLQTRPSGHTIRRYLKQYDKGLPLEIKPEKPCNAFKHDKVGLDKIREEVLKCTGPLSVSDIAEKTGISKSSVRRMLQSGKLDDCVIRATTFTARPANLMDEEDKKKHERLQSHNRERAKRRRARMKALSEDPSAAANFPLLKPGRKPKQPKPGYPKPQIIINNGTDVEEPNKKRAKSRGTSKTPEELAETISLEAADTHAVDYLLNLNSEPQYQTTTNSDVYYQQMPVYPSTSQNRSYQHNS